MNKGSLKANNRQWLCRDQTAGVVPEIAWEQVIDEWCCLLFITELISPQLDINGELTNIVCAKCID